MGPRVSWLRGYRDGGMSHVEGFRRVLRLWVLGFQRGFCSSLVSPGIGVEHVVGILGVWCFGYLSGALAALKC